MELRHEGQVLFRSRELGDVSDPLEAGFLRTAGAPPFRVASDDAGPYGFAVGVSAEGPFRARRQLRVAMAVCLVGGLALAALLARALAERATAPLAAIADAAGRVHDTNPSERLSPSPRNYEEVERVHAAFNQMLDRLEGALLQLRRFTPTLRTSSARRSPSSKRRLRRRSLRESSSRRRRLSSRVSSRKSTGSRSWWKTS